MPIPAHPNVSQEGKGSEY